MVLSMKVAIALHGFHERLDDLVAWDEERYLARSPWR